MRYKVVVSKNIMEFQKLCSDLIEAGYDPVGTFTTSNKEYLQAFVNYTQHPQVQFGRHSFEPKPEPQVQLGRPNALVDYSEPKEGSIEVPKTEEEFLKGFNKAAEADRERERKLNEEPPKRVGRPPKSTSLS